MDPGDGLDGHSREELGNKTRSKNIKANSHHQELQLPVIEDKKSDCTFPAV